MHVLLNCTGVNALSCKPTTQRCNHDREAKLWKTSTCWKANVQYARTLLKGKIKKKTKTNCDESES